MTNNTITQTNYKFVRIIYTQSLTGEAVVNSFQNSILQAVWRPGTNVVLDLRGGDFSGLAIESLCAMREIHLQYNLQIGRIRIALLVDTVCRYGLARQYQLLTEDLVESRIEVFLDEEKAVAWCSEDERPVQENRTAFDYAVANRSFAAIA